MRWTFSGAALAIVVAASGCGQQDQTADRTSDQAADNSAFDTGALPQSMPPITAQDFVVRAAHANMLEIRSSEIAEKKAQRDDVRDFAKRMIRDHTQASEQLEKAATPATMAPPTAIDQSSQDKINDLQQVDDAQFDERYLELQENAHQDAISLFENYQQSAQDPSLRDFASNMLPTLRDHLSRVRALRGQLTTPPEGGAGSE